MNRKPFLQTTIVIAILALTLSSCNMPRVLLTDATATSTATPDGTSVVTATETVPAPFATVELGLAENPLILVLPPAPEGEVVSQAQIDAANVIASQFTQRTGYAVVTVLADDYTSLVDALEDGNAHIALLSPYAYELAYRRGLVQAVYAVLQEGESKYGAQFLATRKGGFTSYFDEGTGENLDEAPIALAQFADKKPCWSDETSPSGYVIPLGYLNESQIRTKPPAFVEGHPTVVRSLYASGICDFGATYIDARKFPSLEDEFPDLLEQVMVVWQIPPIIPYEVLAFSTRMPQKMRDQVTAQIPAILQTEDGKAAFLTAYGIEELEPANDGYYEEFRIYVDEAGVDLTTLLR